MIFGTEITFTLLLAIWGATLSTALAGIKIYELWRGRFQIFVDRILRGSNEVGHDISVTNMSSLPVTLQYLEIYNIQDGEEKMLWSPEDEWLNIKLNAHDTHEFNFSEERYFPWGKQNVYARLHFIGRKRPIVKQIV